MARLFLVELVVPRSSFGQLPFYGHQRRSDHAIHELMIPKGYETAAPGTMPDAKAVEAMMKYNEALQKAGILVALDGLHPLQRRASVLL